MSFPDPVDLTDDTPDPQVHIVPAGHGHAFEVQAERHFRVVDLFGRQVVDLAAWVQGTDLTEKLSMSHSRYRLNGASPAVGEHLWSNKDEPLLEVISDCVRVHDMTFMSCYPEMYEKRGLHNHRSCAGNIAEVMRPYGMRSHLHVTDPFNVFQNTPNYSIKRSNPSRAGDYIQFRALKDLVIAVSCCPYDLDGFNDGKVTDVAVVTDVFSKGKPYR